MSKKEQKYTREAILRCEEFKVYQQDFLAALLTADEYTLTEAHEIASEFFGR